MFEKEAGRYNPGGGATGYPKPDHTRARARCAGYTSPPRARATAVSSRRFGIELGDVGGGRDRFLSFVFFLSAAPRDVLVFPHVHDLTFHGKKKENTEIKQKNRPKHGNIEDAKECHQVGYADSLGRGVPKFEFRYASFKRSKFCALFRCARQTGSVHFRIDLRRGSESDEYRPG